MLEDLTELRERCLREKRQEYGLDDHEATALQEGFRRRLDPEARQWRFERKDNNGLWRPIWPNAGKLTWRERLGFDRYLPFPPRSRRRLVPGLRLRIHEDGALFGPDPDLWEDPLLPGLRTPRHFEYDGPWPWDKGEQETLRTHGRSRPSLYPRPSRCRPRRR